MKPLPLARVPEALLSFDFDGTLHNPETVPPVPDAFFETIRRLRKDHGACWGINTGRSFGHLIEGLRESRVPFLPDWIVAREYEIYRPDHFGRWMPHRLWNRHCDREIIRLFRRTRRILHSIRHHVIHHTDAYWLDGNGETAGIISQTVEEMQRIVSHITPIAAAEPMLSWQRNTIYLRFGHRHFHKGTSLSEVARLLKIPTHRRFAIGDGHNDLEMLDPSHVGMLACPQNAVPEVHHHIAQLNGHIATKPHGDGTVEALQRFFPPPLLKT